SVVPKERSGMASGISTTSRFSGILLGFAMLSGILATMVRKWVAAFGCGSGCHHPSDFADAIVAGDLPSAISGLEGSSREIAIQHAHHAFSYGFAVALLVASIFALGSSITVFTLMHS
ncbi:MFS transporter, partial [Acetobacter pomorum]